MYFCVRMMRHRPEAIGRDAEVASLKEELAQLRTQVELGDRVTTD